MRLATLASVILSVPLLAQNQALQFTSGVETAVEVPFDQAMVPPTGLTVEAWVTYDDSTIPSGGWYWPTIARQNIAPQHTSWLLRVGAANTATRAVEFIVEDGNATLYTLSWAFAAGALANWTHLAVTFDGQIMKLFVNGSQVATRTLPRAFEIVDNGGILRIGNGDASLPGHEAWNGLIDEVRVWPMPRGAAEIQAGMQQELMTVPGHVLTFNCNGSYVDSSSGLVGTALGTVGFQPGPPLTMVMPVALPVGQSTTTCARSLDIGIGSVPMVGNGALRLWCTKVTTSAPLGLCILAARSAPAAQPPLFGVALAVDFTSILTQMLLVPGSSGVGLASVALPVPNNQALSGVGFVAQFGFVDALCGPQGFSASDGLVFGIQ